MAGGRCPKAWRFGVQHSLLQAVYLRSKKIRRQVAIGGLSQLWVSVPEHPLDHDEWNTRTEEKRRGGVPEVMKAERLDHGLRPELHLTAGTATDGGFLALLDVAAALPAANVPPEPDDSGAVHAGARSQEQRHAGTFLPLVLGRRAHSRMPRARPVATGRVRPRWESRRCARPWSCRGRGRYWGLFGLQLSVGYLTSGTTNTTGAVTTQTGVNAVPILLLGRIRLPLGFMAPYVEVGAGVAIASANFLGIEQSSSTQPGFEAVGGGGVDLYFGPVLVGAEVRFIWLTPSFFFSESPPFDVKSQSLNLSGITLAAYVGYRF